MAETDTAYDAQAEWAKAHEGKWRVGKDVLRDTTEPDPAKRLPIIVSTVLLETASPTLPPHVLKFETRVFGGAMSGQAWPLECEETVEDDRPKSMEAARAQHKAKLAAVRESLQPKPAGPTPPPPAPKPAPEPVKAEEQPVASTTP